MRNDDIAAVAAALRKHWRRQSTTLWQPDNPALGNCGVSALVAWEILGGEIAKTQYGHIWHFYNVIDGRRVDFTASQFPESVDYEDVPSNRDEAFADTDADQYGYLCGAVRAELGLDAHAGAGTGSVGDREGAS